MADYNINAITRRVVFTGSAGLGPYAFTFEVLDENDVAVYFNTTLLTLTTDYTVAVNANGTGSVTIVTGSSVPSTPTASDSIIIVGARDIERVTDFVTAGDLLASSLNEQLDALTIFDQQLAEENARTLRAPVYDPALVADGGTLDMTLPAKAARAGKYLQFNSTTGNPEAGPDSTDVTALADIATDIATLADIEDGTDATDAIQTVAGISANVTTVAGIASNVSTVAGIQADVTAVAGDATDIGTVATNIASVNTVAGNISEVVAVANDLNEAVSEVETVANDLNEAVSEIETVAASITNVDTVGTNIANVNTVAGNNANVTTVAGISANVTTVAGISGNVTTVAGISSDVTTVAADGTDIGTVATNIANVNSVAGNATNINSVATNATNINTVAGISANVTTVAGISSDVTAVAGDATDIGTVSTNIANVNTVAGSITNVNTVATNISGVNSFAERYRVAASDPATSLDEGDLAYNTTDNALKYYNGTSWNSITPGIANIVEDTSPQLGGALDVNGHSISFGDNEKARFGNADDLQIYHDGSHSRIDDAGTGNLILRGNAAISLQKYTGEVLGQFTADGAVTLYYDNAEKLATTSSGIDVTGTVTADGLTVDTNTLHVDATNNRVGIGTTAPSAHLQVNGSLGNNTAILTDRNGTAAVTVDQYGQTTFANTVIASTLATNSSGTAMTFSQGASERMRVDSSGNLLVGTTNANPAENNVAGIGALANNTLSITRDGNAAMQLNRKTSDGSIAIFRKDGSAVGSIGSRNTGTSFIALSTTNNTGLTGSGAAVCPSQNGGLADNAVDFGFNTARWKDLYLSGGVYLGGTGSANYLDDYEEGTWTPAIYYQNADDQTNSSNVSQSGVYTKVGNLVTATCYLKWSATDPRANDNIGVNGFPFAPTTSAPDSETRWVAPVRLTGTSYPQGDSQVMAVLYGGGTLATFITANSSSNLGDDLGQNTNMVAYFTITYHAST